MPQAAFAQERKHKCGFPQKPIQRMAVVPRLAVVPDHSLEVISGA